MDSALVRRIVWNVLPAAVIVAVVGMAIVGEEGLIERHALKQRLVVMEHRVENLQQSNDLLEAEIARLKNDPLVQKRAVAETLYLSEPGAVIYRFDEPDRGAKRP